MSFRVGTPNYGLPQTEGTDKRDWSDTNQPFLLIDTAIKNAVDTSATASAAAATAQQTADGATTAATHAQTDATTAQTLATSASELATTAKNRADAAYSLADTASELATTAKDRADAAYSLADTANTAASAASTSAAAALANCATLAAEKANLFRVTVVGTTDNYGIVDLSQITAWTDVFDPTKHVPIQALVTNVANAYCVIGLQNDTKPWVKVMDATNTPVAASTVFLGLTVYRVAQSENPN